MPYFFLTTMEVNHLEDKKFLKTSDVASLLGVHRNTIIEWARNGILTPAQKTESGYSRYTLQQIVEFCKSAQNLLPSAQKCTKSPTIKNKTAQNLQQAETHFEPKKEVSKAEKKLESIRLIPSKMLVMTNDKLSKDLFRCTPEEYLRLFEAGGECVEVKKFPKVGEIITNIRTKRR